MIDRYLERLKQLEGVADTGPAATQARLALPFPVAVFGTLRNKCCNNTLMNKREKSYGWPPQCRHQYESHSPAALPGFCAQGIQLYCDSPTDNGCPFEVYSYHDDHFAEVIAPIDRLESFSPKAGGRSVYLRCLAWLTVLPSTVWGKVPEFSGVPNLSGKRSMSLAGYGSLPKVPCWIYCSGEQAQLSLDYGDASPIIWVPEHFEHAA